MQVTSKDHVLKIATMTRFHFVAGLPKAGARRLAALLAQNPKFSVSSDSHAEQVFGVLNEGAQSRDQPLSSMDAATRAALLRAAMDAVHHARPMDAIVFDNNPKWLAHIELLGELFPLSRFVIMVRDPARIAAEIAGETGGAQTPSSLMSERGKIGEPVLLLQKLLSGPAADRLLLLDYDRLLSDPEHVFDAMYGFLGEQLYTHDFRGLPMAEPTPLAASGLVTRRFVTPGKLTLHRAQKPPLPIWRRSQSSAATMLLPEAG